MRKFLTAIFLLLSVLFHAATAQSVDVSAKVDAAMRLTPRWDLGALVEGAANFDDTKSQWGRFGISAKFQIYESIYAFIDAGVSAAQYQSIDNTERIYSLREGIVLSTEGGFDHILSVDQRRLEFLPYGYTSNCSRMMYDLLYNSNIFNEKYAVKVGCGGVFNVNSEISDSDFMQRVKLYSSLYRKVNDKIQIGLSYSYMFGGKNQIYMGDCHNLHTVKLILKLSSKRVVFE